MHTSGIVTYGALLWRRRKLQRKTGIEVRDILQVLILPMTSLLVLLELLDQHGRLEGETSLFIMGSHSAVRRYGMYMSC